MNLIWIAEFMLAATCAVEAPPRFILDATNAAPFHGEIAHIGPDWSIAMKGGAPVLVRDAIGLRRVGMPLPARPRRPHLRFANGDVLAGEALGGDGRTLHFNPAFAQPEFALAVPFSRVDILWMSTAPRDIDPAAPNANVLEAPRRRDVILMRNGDLLTGDLLAIEARDTRIQNSEEQRIANAKIAAIAFSTELTRRRPPKGTYAHATLTDGSRLTLVAMKGDGDKLIGQTEFKAEVTISWSKIVALDLHQGRVDWLSELKPTKYEYVPYLNERFALTIDRNAYGGPLALRFKDGVNYFDKGVGLHSRCSVSYTLGKKYARFEAALGLDDEQGKLGSASIRFLIDGKSYAIPELKRLTHADGARMVRLDLKEASELTIEVDWAEGGHVGDAINLGNPRLILAR